MFPDFKYTEKEIKDILKRGFKKNRSSNKKSKREIDSQWFSKYYGDLTDDTKNEYNKKLAEELRKLLKIEEKSKELRENMKAKEVFKEVGIDNPKQKDIENLKKMMRMFN